MDFRQWQISFRPRSIVSKTHDIRSPRDDKRHDQLRCKMMYLVTKRGERVKHNNQWSQIASKEDSVIIYRILTMLM